MLASPAAQIDRYELLERLGEGGMGAVFKARARGPRGFEKLVAVKRVRTALAADALTEDRFVEEARIAAQLHHANIVQVFDFGRAEDGLFIVMEWIDGPSLDRLIAGRSEPLPIAHALRVVAEVARGLDCAHRLKGPEHVGVVHRDVTPSNVLVSTDGVVKLTDFGVAAWARPDGPASIAGKVPYMPPEQLRGESLDGRADLFALGVVLYEMLTKERPWPRGIGAVSSDTTLEALGYVPPSARNPSVPSDVDALVRELLAPDRQARPKDAQAVASMVLKISYAHGIVLDPADLSRLAQEHVAARPIVAAPAADVLLATQSAQGLTRLERPAPIDAHADTDEAEPVARRTVDVQPPSRSKGRGIAIGVMLASSAALLAGWFAFARTETPVRAEPPVTVQLRVDSPTAPIAPPEATPQPEAPPPVVEPVAVEVVPEEPAVTKREPRGIRRRVEAPAAPAAPLESAREADSDRTGTGVVNIYTDPWAHVHVDGAAIGRSAPLRGLRLAAGTHVLRLVNPEIGRSAERTIEVRADETVQVNMELH